ncbi:hypothetical protein DFH27DRAFT_529594 [Peziza echinospora]|nr:hypothetical protein DFH27DRAFT_529594 [Peziza echinospora]
MQYLYKASHKRQELFLNTSLTLLVSSLIQKIACHLTHYYIMRIQGSIHNCKVFPHVGSSNNKELSLSGASTAQVRIAYLSLLSYPKYNTPGSSIMYTWISYLNVLYISALINHLSVCTLATIALCTVLLLAEGADGLMPSHRLTVSEVI